MLLFSIIMFVVGAVFCALSIAIYLGKTELIHDYHRTRVTDKAAYGRAFGKAMLTFTASFFISGIVGLFGDSGGFAAGAVAVLLIGMAVGTVCILIVQKKYNGGLF